MIQLTRTLPLLVIGLVIGHSDAAQMGVGSEGRQSSEDRAVAFLSREVPLWFEENHCFSCHNNGDAARALYRAHQLAYPVPARALTDTTDWLGRPLEWDDNQGEPGFSDQKLARIQFSAALVEAFEAGLIEDRGILIEAARALLPYQRDNGSWPIDPEGALGSPVTYGAHLATYMARRTLETADASGFEGAISRANDWLVQTEPRTVPDAASVLIALEGHQESDAKSQQKRCLELIIGSQASDGGWGPYRNSPSEVFDTALVLLALFSLGNEPPMGELIEQGRAYLIRSQLANGGWPETTRPPGAHSYAHYISTSGWATLALLKTR
jgi:hypothetical protein